jgi:hypothetical protein
MQTLDEAPNGLAYSADAAIDEENIKSVPERRSTSLGSMTTFRRRSTSVVDVITFSSSSLTTGENKLERFSLGVLTSNCDVMSVTNYLVYFKLNLYQ